MARRQRMFANFALINTWRLDEPPGKEPLAAGVRPSAAPSPPAHYFNYLKLLYLSLLQFIVAFVFFPCRWPSPKGYPFPSDSPFW